MFPYLKDITLKKTDSISAAMASISRNIDRTGGNGIGLVCKKTKLLGVLTEGDIRRYLMNGGGMTDPVATAMTVDPQTVGVDYDRHLTLRCFEKGVKHLPVVDENGCLIDLILYRDFGNQQERQDRVIRSRAPLRISFAGGGTDLTPIIEKYGGGVISAAISRFCHVELTLRCDSGITIDSLDLGTRETFSSLEEIRYDGKLDLLKSCINICRPDFGFELRTASDEPLNSGLGGSSAMAVAVIGALMYAHTGKMDEYRIAELAFLAERIELGIQGGWQDQYAAAFGGLNHIEFDRNGTIVQSLRVKDPVRLELESNLLLCFSGGCRCPEKVHTANHVSADELNAQQERYTAMSELVDEVRRSILKGRLNRFGRLLDQAWTAKKNIHQAVSNDAIDTAYALAKKNGAVGAKLLGAGKGGYLLLYVESGDRYRLQDALDKKGYRVQPIVFDWQGLRIWCCPSSQDKGKHDRM